MIKAKQRWVGGNKWKQERFSTCDAGWENCRFIFEILVKFWGWEDMGSNHKGNLSAIVKIKNLVPQSWRDAVGRREKSEEEGKLVTDVNT